MNKIRKTVLLLLFSVCAAAVSHAQKVVLDSLKIQGNMRYFWMILPEGLEKDAPVVFVAHGYGNPGKQKTWMNEAARKHKFAVCVPHGLKDPGKHKPSWNVGYPFQQGWKVNDVTTMCKMARLVQKKYSLSKENTFFTGMSNGGEMCYLLAYSDQKVFKAVASLSGLTMEWIYRTMDAPRPLPVFEIHGRADHTSEWSGDLENKGGWGAYMSTPLGIGYWIAKNKCEKLQTDTVKSMTPANKRTIIKHKYSGGPTGCQVWLYEVINGPHSWFDHDIDTGEEVWSFFSQYLTKK